MRQLTVCLCLASATLNARSAAARPENAPAIDAQPEHAWSCSLALAVYIVPDSHEYVQPTVEADHGPLHLEARYNYEALDTASIFVGWNCSVGEELVFDFTPMIGLVFGDASGIAPGFETALTWKQIEFYAEAEYFLDSDSRDDRFFYLWSELSWRPADCFRVGIAGQRTRAYSSDVDIQRGPLVGVTLENLDLTAYVFNLDEGDPTFVFAATFGF
ncbi:MAG: hypothetical protein JNK58_08105 [Phycisphaerae bacterium]|nr:hypothetical protein [Phycisphaerae bacterium]